MVCNQSGTFQDHVQQLLCVCAYVCEPEKSVSMYPVKWCLWHDTAAIVLPRARFVTPDLLLAFTVKQLSSRGKTH